MENRKQLTIGLFGFGVVGEGIYNIINSTPSLHATIKKICIRQLNKQRNAPADQFTTNACDLLEDDTINVIVELIDDADAAFEIVREAMQNGKAVVSANKKMIAEHLAELLDLQEKHQVPFLYEAAVCGSIPVIRNLEEYYDNDLLQGICGIVNGSTNFILTKMFHENCSYASALATAQSLGFAESDPSLDVKGIDAVNKLTILLLHSYGVITAPNKLLHLGINRIAPEDAQYAAEKGLQIRLTAQAKKLSKNGSIVALVLPQFVSAESQLFNVNNEYNGVILQSCFSDKQFLYGKGAGRYPTSSAVLSDISALRYQYKYEYRKLHSDTTNELSNNFYLRLFVSYSNWTDVDKQEFEWVDEYHVNNNRHFIIGVIHYEKLKNSKWLQDENISIILCENGIVECVGERKVKQHSLKLAGASAVNNTDVALTELTTEWAAKLN